MANLKPMLEKKVEEGEEDVLKDVDAMGNTLKNNDKFNKSQAQSSDPPQFAPAMSTKGYKSKNDKAVTPRHVNTIGVQTA